jgi:hypothetical protein
MMNVVEIFLNNVKIIIEELRLWCLTILSTIFQFSSFIYLPTGHALHPELDCSS